MHLLFKPTPFLTAPFNWDRLQGPYLSEYQADWQPSHTTCIITSREGDKVSQKFASTSLDLSDPKAEDLRERHLIWPRF